MSLPRRRGLSVALFLLWTLLASAVLLEVVLQVAAQLAQPPTISGETPADPAAVRILAVGDSWVAGAEAPAGQGFVDVLARRLPERLGRPVQLVNRGRSGANSAHATLAALDALPTLRPALVIVLVGQNNSTNFARVAELEQRLHLPTPSPLRWSDQLRSVKLARILVANLRGTVGLHPPPPSALPTPVARRLDSEGQVVLDPGPLHSASGLRVLRRDLLAPLQPEGDPAVDAAFRVLFAAAERRAPVPADLETLHHAIKGSHDRSTLLRYALLRAAREREDWHAVRSLGGPLLQAPRDLLSELGGAEAALLAGDWRLARALLISASHRAPGFVDVLDLACRFPATAGDVAVQEACEEPPLGAPSPLDRARVADATLDPEGAAQARAAWLEQRPDDLESRVDLALTRASMGDLAGADALLGVVAREDGSISPPGRPDAAHWRYFVGRTAELGRRDGALAAVEMAWAEQAGAPLPSAPLLATLAAVLAEHEACALVPAVADAAFLARGDVSAFADALRPCLPTDAILARLDGLRGAWQPLGARDSVAALARSGRDPSALLARDLDVLHRATQAQGGQLLLLDYPNPSDDHAALAEQISAFAAARALPYVPLRSAFAARFDAATWQGLLGPNGHCNEEGYAVMAELVLSALTPLLSAAP